MTTWDCKFVILLSLKYILQTLQIGLVGSQWVYLGVMEYNQLLNKQHYRIYAVKTLISHYSVSANQVIATFSHRQSQYNVT